MWPFSQLKTLEKLEERDRYLVWIANQSEKGDYSALRDTVRLLSERDHLNDDVTAITLRHALAAVARVNVSEALDITGQVLKAPSSPQSLQNNLVTASAALIKGADFKNIAMATSFVKTGLVMAESVSNKYVRHLALDCWSDTVDRLAGLDMKAAFEETRNAANHCILPIAEHGVKEWKSLLNTCILEGREYLAKEEVMTNGMGTSRLQAASTAFLCRFLDIPPATYVVMLKPDFAHYSVHPRHPAFDALNQVLSDNKVRLSGRGGSFTLAATDDRALRQPEAEQILGKLRETSVVKAAYIKPASSTP